MPEIEPITREEKIWSGENIEPITREEQYIKHIFDKTQTIPSKPITRKEMLLERAGEGGGSDVTIKQLSVTANGTYSEKGTAYSPVIVNVPATPLNKLTVTENGTYTAPVGTGYDEVNVNVPLPENAYLLKEIEDVDIASFSDGSNLPMPKLQVGIEPIQEGSGDPSPENVRPISGHTEANVTRCGKNLAEKAIHGYIKSDTSKVVIDNDSESVVFYAVEGETYKISSSVTMNRSIVGLVDTDDITNQYPVTEMIELGNSVTTWTATWSGWTVWYKCPSSNSDFANSVQVELGNTATTYEPYNGQTYNIQFKDGDNPLKVYGGSLDVVSGVLTVDKKSIDVSSMASSVGYNSGVRAGTLPNTGLKPNITTETISEYISNCLKAHINSGVASMNYEFTVDANSGLLFKIPNCTSASDYQTWVTNNNLQIVGELATPLTIQLTPTEVKSLLGQNNAWCDTGEIEDLEYFSKEV